jgi:hypothetical protein
LALLRFARLPRLQEHEGKRPTGVGSAMAIPAAHGILKQGEAFKILQAETGETETR